MKIIKKYPILTVLAFLFCGLVKPELGFLILGSLILYISIRAMVLLKEIGKKGISCNGKILEYQRDRDGYQSPVIEFMTASGTLVRGKPTIYFSTDLSIVRSYKKMIGQPVLISYKADNPEEFIVSSEKAPNYLIYCLLILISLFFVTIAFSGFLGYSKMW